MKVSFLEAVVNRLRRVYLALLSVLGVAWIVRITAFTPRQDWLRAASIGNLPGTSVIIAVGLVYGSLLVIIFWYQERPVVGTFREGKTGEWTKEDQ